MDFLAISMAILLAMAGYSNAAYCVCNTALSNDVFKRTLIMLVDMAPTVLKSLKMGLVLTLIQSRIIAISLLIVIISSSKEL
ncbi:hypothetical protein Lser_V15G11619 [Lactuca serriola]